MATYVIYESPVQGSGLAGEKARSAPIPADNAKARETLERAGWKLVEEFDHEAADAVTRASTLPRIAQELLAAERGEAVALKDTPEKVKQFYADLEASGYNDLSNAFFFDDHAVDGLSETQRASLIVAGYGTEDALNAATDAQLQEVPGVGAATVRNIRKALKQ